MGTRRRTKKIVVDFSETNRRPMFRYQGRPHGGFAARHEVGPYRGPSTIEFEGTRGRRNRLRKFQAVHLGVSPTGSGVGSWRIDEVVSSTHGPRTITHGYHCSYPDFNTCLRIARQNRHHEE